MVDSMRSASILAIFSSTASFGQFSDGFNIIDIISCRDRDSYLCRFTVFN